MKWYDTQGSECQNINIYTSSLCISAYQVYQDYHAPSGFISSKTSSTTKAGIEWKQRLPPSLKAPECDGWYVLWSPHIVTLYNRPGPQPHHADLHLYHHHHQDHPDRAYHYHTTHSLEDNQQHKERTDNKRMQSKKLQTFLDCFMV